MKDRVLVLDEVAARSIGRQLEGDEFIVFGEPITASEALERVDALKPKIVLMAVQRDDADGEPAAARAVRERCSVPTVFFE